jgi:hypothetical protein
LGAKCQQEAYASSGPGQTPKTNQLGLSGIQQLTFLVEGSIYCNKIEKKKIQARKQNFVVC